MKNITFITISSKNILINKLLKTNLSIFKLLTQNNDFNVFIQSSLLGNGAFCIRENGDQAGHDWLILRLYMLYNKVKRHINWYYQVLHDEHCAIISSLQATSFLH